jgi:hypothetical protein
MYIFLDVTRIKGERCKSLFHLTWERLEGINMRVGSKGKRNENRKKQ